MDSLNGTAFRGTEPVEQGFDRPRSCWKLPLMKMTLNTRTLVGHEHHAAENFLRRTLESAAVEIEWIQSPSARCVLQIVPEDQVLHMQLEQELRNYIGREPYQGDDASGSEQGAMPGQGVAAGADD